MISRTLAPTGCLTAVEALPGGLSQVVAELRERRITPHVPQNAYDTGTAKRRSNIDGRTTRHAGYAISQRVRKRIEEIFGWLKTVAGWRKSRFRGLDRTEWGFQG